MSGPACDFSDEYFLSVLGPEAFARAEALGRNAPPPSPELVERVRRIFAAAERRGACRIDVEPEPVTARAA